MTDSNQLSPIKILLIEDNPGDIRLTKEALKDGKIKNEIRIITDGEEALLFLKKEGQYQNEETPDVILLDLNLPKKDGREVLLEIKSDPNFKTIPVIILTISSDERDILKSYSHYANCYITKPIDFNEFINVVKTIENFWFTIVKIPNQTLRLPSEKYD